MTRDWESVLDEQVSAPQGTEEPTPELRPLLRVAKALRALSPSEPAKPQAVVEGRSRFLAQAAAYRAERAYGWWVGPWLSRLAVTAATVVILTAILGGGAVWASADSLPGDPLYDIKLLAQELRLFFTFDPQAKAELRFEIEEERVHDVRLVVEERRQTEVDFRGIVKSIADNLWLVAGLEVAVNAQTEFEGGPQVGDFVHVHALVQADGSLLAREIELEIEEFELRLGELVAELRGPLGSLSAASAIVCGVDFVVAANTEIEGSPQAGDPVKVEFAMEPNGDFLMIVIEVEEEEEECELRVEGTVEVAGDTVASSPWVIEGIEIFVNAATEVRGAPQAGDLVKVRAAVDTNGDFLALRLEEEGEETEEGAGETPVAELQFEGTLEAFSTEAWVVSGRSVQVRASTEIRGSPVVGAHVEVRALQQADGTLVATRLEVEQFQAQEIRWEGRIESMEGNRWVIAGRAVQVTNSTEIRGTPAVGVEAEVRALLQPDGSLVATRIEIEGESSGSGSG